MFEHGFAFSHLALGAGFNSSGFNSSGTITEGREALCEGDLGGKMFNAGIIVNSRKVHAFLSMILGNDQ